jgi:hypothetical protein
MRTKNDSPIKALGTEFEYPTLASTPLTYTMSEVKCAIISTHTLNRSPMLEHMSNPARLRLTNAKFGRNPINKSVNKARTVNRDQ